MKCDCGKLPLLSAERIVGIANRHLRQRQCCELEISDCRSDREAGLRLGVDPSLPPEGYRLEMIYPDRLEISGGSTLGILYGIGKMLRDGHYADGNFTFGSWRGQSFPSCSFRCVYFATHFYNFHHVAPLGQITEYLEDLALLGFNAIAVWPDKHHFLGINDPVCQTFLARLRSLLQAASDLGMGILLGALTNEGYASTPEALRAQPTGRCHYGVEICPNTPGGMELILKNHRDTLEYFAGLNIKYYSLGSYDQGGCGCEQCRPWGINGMVKTGEKVAELVHRHLPSAQIVYFTWLFDFPHDQGEWQGLDALMQRNGAPWIDAFMADSHDRFPRYPLEHGIPGKRPLLNFPEISMRQLTPWGGSGANPMPNTHAVVWGEVCSRSQGGMLYSEGIYEDLNKAVYAGFYWNGNNATEERLREYASFELGCPPEEYAALRRAIAIFEDNTEFRIRRLSDFTEQPEGFVKVKYGHGEAWLHKVFNSDPKEAYDTIERLNSLIPAWAALSWRWQLLRLRADIELELYQHPQEITSRCAECFAQLNKLYLTDEDKSYWELCPPTHKMIVGH